MILCWPKRPLEYLIVWGPHLGGAQGLPLALCSEITWCWVTTRKAGIEVELTLLLPCPGGHEILKRAQGHEVICHGREKPDTGRHTFESSNPGSDNVLCANASVHPSWHPLNPEAGTVTFKADASLPPIVLGLFSRKDWDMVGRGDRDFCWAITPQTCQGPLLGVMLKWVSQESPGP